MPPTCIPPPIPPQPSRHASPPPSPPIHYRPYRRKPHKRHRQPLPLPLPLLLLLLLLPSTAHPTSAAADDAPPPPCSQSVPCSMHVAIRRHGNCSATITETMTFPPNNNNNPRNTHNNTDNHPTMLRDLTHIPTIQHLSVQSLHRNGTPITISLRSKPGEKPTSNNSRKPHNGNDDDGDNADGDGGRVLVIGQPTVSPGGYVVRLRYTVSNFVMRLNVSCDDVPDNIGTYPTERRDALNAMRWRAGVWEGDVVPSITVRLSYDDHKDQNATFFHTTPENTGNKPASTKLTTGGNGSVVTLRDVASHAMLFVVEEGVAVCREGLRCVEGVGKGGGRRTNVGWILFGIVTAFWVVAVCVALLMVDRKRVEKNLRSRERGLAGGGAVKA